MSTLTLREAAQAVIRAFDTPPGKGVPDLTLAESDALDGLRSSLASSPTEAPEAWPLDPLTSRWAVGVCTLAYGGLGSWTLEWRRIYRDAVSDLRHVAAPTLRECVDAAVEWEAENDLREPELAARTEGSTPCVAALREAPEASPATARLPEAPGSPLRALIDRSYRYMKQRDDGTWEGAEGLVRQAFALGRGDLIRALATLPAAAPAPASPPEPARCGMHVWMGSVRGHEVWTVCRQAPGHAGACDGSGPPVCVDHPAASPETTETAKPDYQGIALSLLRSTRAQAIRECVRLVEEACDDPDLLNAKDAILAPGDLVARLRALSAPAASPSTPSEERARCACDKPRLHDSSCAGPHDARDRLCSECLAHHSADCLVRPSRSRPTEETPAPDADPEDRTP